MSTDAPRPSEMIDKEPSPQSQGGSKCRTCSNLEWRDEVHRCFEKTIDKPEWCLETIHKRLVMWGYEPVRNSLKHHMVKHETDLWMRWNAARGTPV